MQAERYAIYYLPEGDLARFGAEWLGWDCQAGAEVAQPAIAGMDLAELTDEPRKYGFHATIKPPFHLAGTLADLQATVAALAARLAPAEAPALRLDRIGRFLALTPEGDGAAIRALAAETVRALDSFRAPASEADLARRRKAGLTPAQEANLTAWGYPYVMEEFRFHMTLSGSLECATRDFLFSELAPRVKPVLPRPFRLDSLCLLGQGADKRFRLIQRYPLTGAAA